MPSASSRHHDLIAARTRAICRLHTTVTFLVEGHLPRRLRAERAARILAGIRPTTAIGVERKAMARDLLAEVRRLDRELTAHHDRICEAVIASGTTLTELHGVGPLVAAYLIGHSGEIWRLPSAGHFARYNATAPDRGIQRTGDPASAEPARQPTAQPRHPHDRRHPRPPRHPRARLLPAQADRGPQPQKGHRRPRRPGPPMRRSGSHREAGQRSR